VPEVREAQRTWTALVVDDTAEARRLLAEKLISCGFRVRASADPFDALERFAEIRPDLVVTDLRMPGRDGIDLVRRIREFSTVPIIVVTSYPSIPTCETAIREGAQRFLRWREDLDRLGEIALELVSTAKDAQPQPAAPELSAIRARRQDELRQQLEALLRECHGNIAQIAARLNRDRSTVTYHLKRLGLFDRDRSGTPG